MKSIEIIDSEIGLYISNGIVMFWFTRVVFWMTWSTFHILATFLMHLGKYRDKSLDIVSWITNAHYIDDLKSYSDKV